MTNFLVTMHYGFTGKTGDHVRNNREESSGGDPAITALGNDPVVCRSWLFIT